MHENQLDQPAERRKKNFPALWKFVREKFFIVLRTATTNRRRVDVVGLHDDFAGQIRATRPTCRLRYQRETIFRHPKVRETQRRVRIQHADRRHAADVVTFGDHLRPE